MASQSAPGTSGSDPVQVDSQHYTIEVETEKVRVLRARYGPHEKSQMHGHPALIGVMLTGGLIRFTYPDGRSEQIMVNAGQVMNFPATEHLPENVTDQPLEVILVEIKS